MNTITPKPQCDFCSQEIIAQQEVCAGRMARVLYPLNPVTNGHLMLVPKRHVQMFTDLSADEVIELQQLLVNTYAVKDPEITGFNLLNNNGVAADQHIDHVHIHIFLRKKGDTSPFDILARKVSGRKVSNEVWTKELRHWRSLLS